MTWRVTMARNGIFFPCRNSVHPLNNTVNHQPFKHGFCSPRDTGVWTGCVPVWPQ